MGSYDLWSNRNPSVLNWNTIIGYDHSNVLGWDLDSRWASKMVSRPVANDNGVRHKTTVKLPILGHHKSMYIVPEIVLALMVLVTYAMFPDWRRNSRRFAAFSNCEARPKIHVFKPFIPAILNLVTKSGNDVCEKSYHRCLLHTF